MKKRFTEKLVLVTLDLDKEIKVGVEVSDFVTGDILSIKFIIKRY